MRLAILCDSALDRDRTFLEDALQEARHSVTRLDERAVRPQDLTAYDAVITSFDVAARLSLLETGVRPRCVVASRFPHLLAPLEPRGVPVLALPCKAIDVQSAVEDDAVGARARRTIRAPAFDGSAQNEALAQAGLTTLRQDAQLSSFAALVARGLDIPTALVTLVDADEQRFVGEHGLPDDLHAAGACPREWSFCQHVVQGGAPLVVEDALALPGLASTPLVAAGLVRSYAGVPVRVPGGSIVGAVCALSSSPRSFTAQDLVTLELAARAVEARLQTRGEELRHLGPDDLESEPPLAGAAPPPLPAAARRAAPPPPLPGPPRRPTGDADAPRIGAMLGGKYLLTARLGQGGMAEVYLARDIQLQRLVAIKVLATFGDDAQLLREARQLARIRHTCIVQLFDWGTLAGGRPYLVLEYVRGTVLRDRVVTLRHAGSWMPLPEVASVLRNLSGALETLHGAGLVHGDVKPANVLLDPALHRAVLIDFGLAMNASEGASGPHLAGGTAGYSAPEQLDAAHPTAPHPTLDVYALAALAYMMLIGEGPFARPTAADTITAQRAGRFRPPSERRSELSAAVDAVFARGLAVSPEARYGTVTALVDALDVVLGVGVHAGRKLSAATRLGMASEGKVPHSTGRGITAVRAAVRELKGRAEDARILETLSAEDCDAVLTVAEPDRLYPSAPLSAYLRAFARSDPWRILDIGEQIARSEITELLHGLQIDRAPQTLLRAAEPLFHRWHTWGRFTFSHDSTDSSRVHLHIPRELAPELCALAAGMLRGMVLLARRRATLRKESCSAHDEACTFVVSWSAD